LRRPVPQMNCSTAVAIMTTLGFRRTRAYYLGKSEDQ
jgi:hypothetical protein